MLVISRSTKERHHLKRALKNSIRNNLVIASLKWSTEADGRFLKCGERKEERWDERRKGRWEGKEEGKERWKKG